MIKNILNNIHNIHDIHTIINKTSTIRIEEKKKFG